MIQIPYEIEKQLLQLNVSRESLVRLKLYAEILLKWQSSINLIGPATVPKIWERHILDAAQLLPLIGAEFEKQTIVDIGSGAGVPGLILAICRPQWELHLVESNSKKAAFLRDAARITGVKVAVEAIRIEKFTEKVDFRVDWITSRALAPMDRLLELVEPIIKSSKALFHKGQDIDAELTVATKCWNIGYKLHPSLVETNSYIVEVIQANRQRANAI